MTTVGMTARRQAGRLDTRARAENSHLQTQAGGGGGELGPFPFKSPQIVVGR